jgi:molybdopterin converting factor small subunit
MLHLHFSSAFLPQIGMQDIEITEEISTLRDLFAYLSARFPDWAEEIGVEGDTPDYNLLTAINGQLSISLQGLDTAFKDGDRVEFHLLLTGG